jgi:two-component system sensor histidine kinase UhpB
MDVPTAIPHTAHPVSPPHRLLLLMDHSLDFVELLGGAGVIQGVSAAIKSLGGYDPNELVGTHYQDLIHPEDCARATAAFESVLASEHSAPITLRYHRKDGSWRTVRASARNFLADPAVQAIVVLTRDVTEQLDAETSLAAANVELRRLSQRLLSAQETERAYIARELHDDVQQTLVGLRLGMEAERQPSSGGLAPALLESWRVLVQEAIDHLRDLTMRLRPPVFDDRGLAAEIRAHVERVAAACGRDVRLELARSLGRLAPATELACFRIVQESLANALRHSQADHLRVSVTRAGGNLHVSVRDDGIGFDVASARASAIDAGRVGLASMAERAALVGGELGIESRAGAGTVVTASLPIVGSPIRSDP